MTGSLKKIIAVSAAAVLAAAVCTAATLAYLTASPEEPLTNTFISEPGLITADGLFVLNETDVEQQADYSYWFVADSEPKVTAIDYELVPGKNVPKDPAVRIKSLSSAESVLFLEVVDGVSENPYLSFEIDAVWTKVRGISGKHGGDVYVYSPAGRPAVLSDEYGRSHPEVSAVNILKNKTVNVAGTDGNGRKVYDLLLGEDGLDLSFYAYLCQANAAGDSSMPADIFIACGFAAGQFDT